MKDLKKLLKQSEREIAASSTTSPTEAGRTDPQQEEALVDAINQVFSLFRINYHNQFHAAFSDTQLLNQAKRLWKEALKSYGTQQILAAARRVIEESEYLPTVQRMLKACESELEALGVPNVRAAYLEAANAPSPKNAQDWSHPIVYLAGKTVGWYAMSHLGEEITFPAYRDAYRELVKQLLAGTVFKVDRPEGIEHQKNPKASVEAIRQELQALRQILDD